jgi:hypothetical protein
MVSYASSRQVLTADYLPADESHPIRPADFNGVRWRAAESTPALLAGAWHRDRLASADKYGPRRPSTCPRIHRHASPAPSGRGLTVFGDGAQLRDMI